MTRFVPVTVLVVVLAASRVAGADMGSLPGGATLTFDRLYIHENGGVYQEPSDPDARRYYFNLAHCVCSEANAGKETTFEYLLKLSMTINPSRSAQFWVGTSCDDNMLRGTMCRQLTSAQLPDINTVATQETKPEFSIYDVIAGLNKGQGQGCPRDEGVDRPIFLLMDTDGMGGIDYSLVKNVGQAPSDTASGVDTKPPPPPENLTAAPSEGAIQLSWKVPASRATDIYGYQALCAKADGMAVRTSPPGALYRTTDTLCGIPNDQTLLVASDGGISGTIPLPDELVQLNSSFICGETRASTATSMTIDHLENGMPYNVLLLAVDLHGNYAGTYLTDTVTPRPVIDFWEDLHDRGSKTEGGLCLLAETYGDDSGLTNTLRSFRDDTLGGSRLGRWLNEAYYATLAKLGVYVHGSIALRIIAAVVLTPVVVLALLWHWLTLPGLVGLLAAAWWWRRRRGVARLWGLGIFRARTMRIAVGIAVITLGASRARAGGYQPYWESTDPTNNENQAAADDPGLVTWHAGIRVGPYIPDIDKQFGMEPGPYQQMFGGYRVLPMLDVDRILWAGFGQVGVGGTIGYMQKTAHAFVMGSDPANPKRPTERGARNTFALIPFALTATYRFTWLDDSYGIPLVPYVRGGLSYYVWWVKAPNGSFAQVCKDDGMEPDCSQNKALGASFGVQGSIGLAIRAENIDASAAISMRQSGIQHAGIYGELSLAKVDGFGSDKKLSVGDRTWFAGVDFEF